MIITCFFEIYWMSEGFNSYLRTVTYSSVTSPFFSHSERFLWLQLSIDKLKRFANIFRQFFKRKSKYEIHWDIIFSNHFRNDISLFEKLIIVFPLPKFIRIVLFPIELILFHSQQKWQSICLTRNIISIKILLIF